MIVVIHYGLYVGDRTKKWDWYKTTIANQLFYHDSMLEGFILPYEISHIDGTRGKDDLQFWNILLSNICSLGFVLFSGCVWSILVMVLCFRKQQRKLDLETVYR